MCLRNDDILVLAASFWDEPKRVRHKMPLAWARAGNRILWMEQSPFPGADWRIPGALRKSLIGGLKEVEDRLWVGSAPPAIPTMYKGGIAGNTFRDIHYPFYLHRVKRYMKTLGFEPKIVVLFQQAARHDMLNYFSSACKIYYHHDVYGFGEGTRNHQNTLRVCCQSADMVWCVSKLHQEELIKYNPSTFHIPHAVDLNWWLENRADRPVEYREIPHPRAVFTGVFTYKMDLPVLLETAENCPDWNFVFVGPVIERRLDKGLLSQLRARDNVHFPGKRDVAKLPGYMAGADALILPYLANPNTKDAGLALKFYEYLVTGKPIVTTPFTDLQIETKDIIYIAKDGAAWAKALDICLNETDKSVEKKRRDIAKQNTYTMRVETQKELIGRWRRKRSPYSGHSTNKSPESPK